MALEPRWVVVVVNVSCKSWMRSSGREARAVPKIAVKCKFWTRRRLLPAPFSPLPTRNRWVSSIYNSRECIGKSCYTFVLSSSIHLTYKLILVYTYTRDTLLGGRLLSLCVPDIHPHIVMVDLVGRDQSVVVVLVGWVEERSKGLDREP